MNLSPVMAVPFPVIVETTSRVHLRYKIHDRTLDDGRCGIDDNWVEIDPDRIAEFDLDRLCQFCFPR